MIFVFHDKSWEITNSIIKLDFHSVEFIAVKKCFRCSDFDKKKKSRSISWHIFRDFCIVVINMDSMNFGASASPLDDWLGIRLSISVLFCSIAFFPPESTKT